MSYQLRWLFYRSRENFIFTPNTKWHSHELCSNCKHGASMSILFMNFNENGDKSNKQICINCTKQLIKIPNKTIQRKLYLTYTFVCKYFWTFLDKIHLVRYSFNTRYGLFGDECKHASMEFNENWEFVKYHNYKRKWWEYILIKK